MLHLKQIDVTGCQIIEAITPIGHLGPKDHGTILGRGTFDGNICVSEQRQHGYQISVVEEFISRYCENAKVQVRPKDSKFIDCEGQNRAMYGTSTSSQGVRRVIGVAACVGAFWYLKRAR